MSFEGVTHLISNLGFPIACTAYVLYTQNTTMKHLGDMIHNNTSAVERLITKLGKDEILEEE